MLSNLNYSQFLHLEYFGNAIYSYLLFFISLIILYILLKIVLKRVIVKASILTSKTKTDLDDLVIRVVYSVKTVFYFYTSLFFSLKFLNLSPSLEKIISYGFVMVAVYQVIVSSLIFVDYIFSKISAKKDDAGTKEAIKTLEGVFKGVLWVIGVLLVLQNIGFNVTSLLAGLGIGGVAIALALQNILSDLFSSFALLFDKPFIPGDFIVVGENMGVVEKIGIKTTKIRDLQGEQIIISNKELTSSRVMNFKRMEERRVPFKFGVEYSTKTKELKKIPSIVKKIVESTAKTRFDRANFVNFSDSSLDFEVVYYVLSPDYNEFLNTHEEILLKIDEAFEKEKISFAFPSRSVYLSKNQA